MAVELTKYIYHCQYCGEVTTGKNCKACGTAEQRKANQRLQEEINIENQKKGYVVTAHDLTKLRPLPPI